MMLGNKIERSQGDETYHDVMALYQVLREEPQHVRRAEMKTGEVKAEAIDFVCDVEVKAKRTFSNDPYALAEWWRVLRDPSQYTYMPVVSREALGLAFQGHNLGVDGHYKSLFFRVKNAR